METTLTTLLIMGLQASLLIAIIIAFRGIFKKIPKIYIYTLWLVMLVRLMVPVMFESNYGITPSPEQITISSPNQGITNSGTVQEFVPNTNNSASTDNLPSSETNNSVSTTTPATPGANANTNTNEDSTIHALPDGTQITVTPAPSIMQGAPIWKQAWFLPALATIWGIGAFAVLLVTALQYITMKFKLQFAIRIEDNIWECETVTSPFVMGLLQPKIYLPVNLPEDEKKYILSHEQMHIKHYDHIIRMIMTLATAIHWWNPVVWVAMNLMKKDMEMLCDEAATTKQEPNYRKEYSLVLLKYAAKNSGLSPVVCFGESNTAKRVKHLMFLKKPKFYINIAMVIAMSLCLMSCMAHGVDDTQSYIPKETVTLNMYSDITGLSGLQQGWFADVLLEKFNVKLNITAPYTDSEENPYMGDYDIIFCGDYPYSAFVDAINNGHILDLSSKMQEFMPHISQYLAESYMQYSDISANGIYWVRASTSNPGDYTPTYTSWNLRFDYYKELGMPEITTIDDWVAVLEQMQTAHPVNENGDPVYATDVTYVDKSSYGKMFEISDLVTGYYGYESIGMGFYDWKNNQYHDVLEVNADGSYGPYLKMLKIYNDLYQRGLLYIDKDPDTITEAETSMMENGQYLANMLHTTDNNEYMYPVIPKDANLLTYELGSFAMRCIAIDSETKYPELAMAIVDYFYSPEGALTLMYGPEGECWYYDEKGNVHLTELGLACINDRDTIMSDNKTYADGMPIFGFSPYTLMATNTDTNEPYDYTYWNTFIATPANEAETAWREWSGFNSVENYVYNLDSYYKVPLKDVSYEHSDSTIEAVSQIITDKCWEAIQAPTDADFDHIVQEMITLANEAGYEDCIETSYIVK